MASASHADEPETWFLMSRHGDCAEIKTLQRKIPKIGSINNPETFLKLMKKKGFKAEVDPLKGSGGNAISISVPEKGLHLIFVKQNLCKKMIRK